MSDKIGRLLVEIGASTTQLERSLGSLDRRLSRFGGNMQRIGQNLTMGLTVPLVALGGSALKAAGNFDQAMARSTAIMGNLGESTRQEMEKVARGVAKSTTLYANQTAAAYYYLGIAGLDAQKSMKALPAVTQFATAGAFDLSTATDLLTDAQSALGLSVENAVDNYENMVRVSDVLVGGQSLANASTQESLRPLLTRPALRSGYLEAILEEGTALIAAWADQGFAKGVDAGTKLDIVLRDLQKTATQGKTSQTEYYRAVFDTSGEMRNLADIIEYLENRLALSDEQRYSELALLGFTDKSKSATASLIGLSEKIRGYEEDLRGMSGMTDRVANKQLANFNAKLTVVAGKFHDVGISIGKSLMPTLERLAEQAEALAGWVDGMAKKFEAWGDASKDLATRIALVVAALGPLGIALGFLVKGLAGVIGYLKVFVGLIAKHKMFVLWAVAAGLAVKILNKWKTEAEAAAKAQARLNEEISKRPTTHSEEWLELSHVLEELTKKHREVRKAIKEYEEADMGRAPEEWRKNIVALNEEIGRTIEKLDALGEPLEGVKSKVDGLKESTEQTTNVAGFFGEVFGTIGEVTQAGVDGLAVAADAFNKVGAGMQAQMDQMETWRTVWTEYAENIKVNSARIAKDTTHLLESTITGFTRGLGNAFAQTLVYGKSFSKGMQQLGQQMAASFIANLVDIGAQLLIHWVLSKFISLALLKGKVGAAAGEAAAGASAWAHILYPPPLGSIMASIFGPAAAAQTLAMGSIGLTGMREGGMTLGEGVAYLHPDEVVAPFGEVKEMLGGGQEIVINHQTTLDGEVIAENQVRYLEGAVKAATGDI